MYFTAYGIIISVSLLIGFFIFRTRALQSGISSSRIENISFILLLSGIIGARVYHIITEYKRYVTNPSEVFSITSGGVGILGALFAGIVVTYLYSRYIRINAYRIFDSIVLSVVVSQIIGRFANIINSEILPYAYYEIALNICILLSLLITERLVSRIRGEGTLWGMYLCMYGTGRFFLEWTRQPRLDLGLISFTQGMCFIIAIYGAILLYRSRFAFLPFTPNS